MPLSFHRSWTDPSLDVLRDSAARFIDSEMLPAR